jgi:hypothetical protein
MIGAQVPDALPDEASTDAPIPTDAEQRQALRTFLQRCEVRLSTMHRVATALLSGAGIMVLLPAVERDAVTSVMRALLHGTLDLDRGLLAVAVGLSIVLVIALVWMVMRQLTQFYFHAIHISRDGVETFAPRFTLTSLRLPMGELDDSGEAEYLRQRNSQHNIELVVPDNPTTRRRIDRQLNAYPALQAHSGRTDIERIDSLLSLMGARRRELIDEVVKIEHGMARHMLRLQVVVLRYVKAVLAVVITLLASFVADASLDPSLDPSGASQASQRWIAATMAIWAPLVIIAVSTPVRWVESMLRAEGAARSTVRNDPEMVHVENIASSIASVAWLVAFVALTHLSLVGGLSAQARISTIAAWTISAVLLIVSVVRWRNPRLDRWRTPAP